MSPEREFDIDYSERAGFLTGKSAAIAEWLHKRDKRAFAKQCDVLRADRWRRNNPERAKANNEKASKKKFARRREENAELVRGHVLTCARCGTQWCRLPLGKRTSGTTPKYCPNGCLRKAMNERAYADQVRRAAAIARACAWQKENVEQHRTHTREYARRKRLAKASELSQDKDTDDGSHVEEGTR